MVLLLFPTLLSLACSDPFAPNPGGCADEDGDTYCNLVDCDDWDPYVNPASAELWYDGVDQDCDGNDADQDLDGYDDASVGGADCDDSDPSLNPSAVETWYDGIDSDCDGADDYDADGDGYSTDTWGGEDCDDSDHDVNPGATERWYDGVDSDCDGADDYDADGDGVQYPYDCDDDNYLDARDSDCKSDPDDADGDGFDAANDCDDGDATVYPGATETWYDGIDSDCGADDDYDADGDDAQSADYGGDDCDDTDPTIHTDATEILGDGVDQDCDGGADTAPFTSLSLSGSTGLQGPRIGEYAGGVVVGVLVDSYSGGAIAGSIWNVLSASSPGDGSMSVTGWSYSASSVTLGTGYDLTADGSYVIEAYTSYEGPATYATVAAINVSAGAISTYTEGFYTSEISDFQDVKVAWDGSTVGVAFCEQGSPFDLVAYVTGSMSTLYNNPANAGYAFDATGYGGAICAVDVANDKVQTSHTSTGTTTWEFDSASETLDRMSTSGTVYDDLEWVTNSSGTLCKVGIPGSYLEIAYGASSTTYSTSGTPAVARLAVDGGDLYILYVDTGGQAWLVYGSTTSTLTEVALSPGFGSVSDGDVFVTSAGALVVALRNATQVASMGIAL